MADKLAFELVSPEKLLISAEVDMVVVPGTEGDFGVLSGHAPVVSTLRPGVIDVSDDTAEARIFVRGGFAEVTPAGLTILAEDVLNLAELDTAELDQRIQNATEDVADAADDITRAVAQAVLDNLREIRATL